MGILFKSLKSKNGFSLMEVMVATGLMGVVSLGTMSIMKIQSQGMRSFKQKSEAQNLTRVIQAKLANGDACTFTLQDIKAAGGTVTDKEIRSHINTVLYTAGTTFGSNKLKITDMTVNAWPADGTTGNLNFKVDYQFPKVGSPGDFTQRSVKIDNIQVEIDGAGNVTKCYFDKEGTIASAREENCIDLGGAWDSAASTCTLASANPGDAASVGYTTVLTNDLQAQVTVNADNIAGVYLIDGSKTLAGSLKMGGNNIANAGSITGSSLNVGTGAIAAGSITSTGTIKSKNLSVGAGEITAGSITSTKLVVGGPSENTSITSGLTT